MIDSKNKSPKTIIGLSFMRKLRQEQLMREVQNMVRHRPTNNPSIFSEKK